VDRLGRHTKDAIALLAIGVGAFLRFDGLGVPSYWLDEILGQTLTTKAAAQPWWRWLIGFAEEHGPLYYASQLVGRVFGTSEFAGRLLPALFGVATIVLVWLATRSVAAPILMAVSPLAVYYSREARPYALLMMLTAAVIVLLLRCGTGSQPVRGREAAACAVIVAIAYTSAVSAPVIAAALIVALVRRRWWIAGVSAASLALLPLLYRTSTQITSGFSGVDVMTLLRTFSVSALGTPIGGRAAVAMFVLAVIGGVALARSDRRTAIVIIGMTALPLAIAIAALRAFDHWYGARYVAPALVGYVMLAGYGIAALTRRFTIAAPLIAIVLAWQAWPAARVESFQKLDWRAIAAKIHSYAHKGDLVIAAEPWSEVALRYYLRRLPPRVQLEGVPYAPVTEGLVRDGTWLVSSGFGDTTSRSWMCRYPVVLASPLERFRMHYAKGDFLRERAGPAEWRAVSAALGPHVVVDLAAAQNRFLDAGWADPEGFRWAVGTRAAVTVPRWGTRERTIRMRVMPMHHAKLPPQTLRASVNGQPVGEITLPAGWSEPALTTPASVWRDGMNTLTFDFGRAAAPADLDPRTTDHRELAVAFDWIVVDDEPGPARPHAYVVHIASAPFIDETGAWRNTRTRFPAAPAALAGRLGFDPAAASRVHLEDLVESVSYGTDCEDDRAFLRRAFALILDRPPDRHEEAALANLPRARVPVRLTKSEEFRRHVILSREDGEGSPPRRPFATLRVTDGEVPAAAPDRASAPGTRTPRTRTP
jgi:mannosyltransferase